MKHKITMKEYEALATMRDIALILRNEISENIGYESESLTEAATVLERLACSCERQLS